MDSKCPSTIASRQRLFRRSYSGALLLFTAFFAACTAPPKFPTPVVAPSPASAELADACERFRVERGIVGLSVAILRDGRVVFERAFGAADRERALPATPATLYRLASISKPVTATIALQLVEEGVLDLDRDLRDYAPHLRERLPAMTLADVLSHTSGLRHYRDDRVDNSTTHRTTHESLDLFLSDPLLFAPRAKYSYSTHAYTVVADVLEHVTGRSYVDLVRERVRDRGLPTLDVEVLADSKPARSALYSRVESGPAKLSTPREDLSWKYAGGGLESTALDLARFGDAVRTGALVSPASRNRMWRATTLADGTTSNYGLGWRLEPARGEVFHTGSQQGANGCLVLVPKDALVIAILTNTLDG